MARLEILTYAHPALRSKTSEVTQFDDELLTLVEDMVETMYEGDGVGLAAPQIGNLQRLFVYDVGEGAHAVVNPSIYRMQGEEVGEEGCLSIPRLQGDVSRAVKIGVTWQDETGRKFKRTFEGFTARVFQHETDHLDGILYTDRAIPGTLRLAEETSDDRMTG